MRGRPFELGNKMGQGRPPGSRNKKTILQELFEVHGPDIIRQIQFQALKEKPDPMILRSCFERLIPIAKAPRCRFHLPPIRKPEDLPAANAAVAKALANGRISAFEGEALSRILVNQRTMFDEDFDRRLRVVEQRKADE
jgi:hypothetical protein